MMMINIWEAGIFYGKMDGRTGCSRFPDPLWDGTGSNGKYTRGRICKAAGKRSCGKIQDPSGPGGKWRLPVVGRIPAIGTGSSDLAGQ